MAASILVRVLKGFDIVDPSAIQCLAIAWVAGLAVFLQLAYYAPDLSWHD